VPVSLVGQPPFQHSAHELRAVDGAGNVQGPVPAFNQRYAPGGSGLVLDRPLFADCPQRNPFRGR